MRASSVCSRSSWLPLLLVLASACGSSTSSSSRVEAGHAGLDADGARPDGSSTADPDANDASILADAPDAAVADDPVSADARTLADAAATLAEVERGSDGPQLPPSDAGGEPDAPVPWNPGCGDGTPVLPEQCDDGNRKAGDGCSPICKLEPGFTCSGTPSVCSATVCGDGKQEGTETCDDGNRTPFDGCSEDCQVEPSCSGGNGCTSRCGDGLVINEACDDGNSVDGDGCSSGCTIEPGWTCQQPKLGDKRMASVIYRDFRFQRPTDFENGSVGSYDPFQGIVESTLDAQGKPVFTGTSGAHIASTDSFKQWFTDVTGVNHATPTKLALWSDGQGNYVNRYGADGEQWTVTMPAYWCGTVGAEALGPDGAPVPCTYRPPVEPGIDAGPTLTDCQKLEGDGYVQVPGSCHAESGTYKALYAVSKVDGNPLFFPVDEDTFTPTSERVAAQIPPYYDASNTWPYDLDAAGAKRMHNFSFTTELRAFFRYDKSQTYTLDFVGDDDLWVFINGKLAVDLGGVHVAVDGRLVIGADGNGNVTVTATYPPSPAPAPKKQTAKLGLQDGVVYEIAVFQAERQSTSSSLKVTLPPFNTSASECTPQ